MKRSSRKKLRKTTFKKDFDLLDLYKAYWDCRKHKRSSRAAIEFEYNLEYNMRILYEDLKTGKYEIGKSICFVVLEPKPREVWAASFRDRIVHHLVYNIIKDRFYAAFIKETYSCIPKRGTLNGAIKTAKFAQGISRDNTKKAYYLKADIKNFFVSIDKQILYKLTTEKVPEIWLRNLIGKIIFNDPKCQAVIQSPKWKFDILPSYKSLWNTNNEKGLPIGNLTSQFFSNVYLNKLDQFVKHKLKCRYYCRYVDDFVIMDKSPERLNFCYCEIAKFLSEDLKLLLHKRKRTTNLIKNGIDFAGFNIKPNRMFLRQKTIKKMFKIAKQYEINKLDIELKEACRLLCVFNSYVGQLRAINGYNLRKKLCEKIVYPAFYPADNFNKIKKMYAA